MNLLKASIDAARLLSNFKRTSEQAAEREDRIDLAPAELWEPQDQAVLDRLEREIRIAKGETPLLDTD